jgi:hypothetical protein
LIVAIDANGGNVERRLEQLRTSLSAAHLESRGNRERIVHLIPKRSIETWILCLTGKFVDEEKDHSSDRDIDQLLKPAAEILFDWTRPNAAPSNTCVPSLRAAISELRRLE